MIEISIGGHMKKLILIAAILLLSTTAYGAPYLVSDPQANTETYEIVGTIVGTVPAQPDGSLRYDLVSVPVGNHTIQVSACVGVWCSDPSPFAFTRPELLGPANIRLVK